MNRHTLVSRKALDEIISSRPDIAAGISGIDLHDTKDERDESIETDIQRMDGIRKQDQIAETYMEMFSDLRRAGKIVIAMISSPTDLINSNIIYGINYRGSLPPALRQTLIDKIKDRLEVTYGFKKFAKETINQLVIGNGAVPMAVIPEAVIPTLSSKNYTSESYSNAIINKGKVAPMGVTIKESVDLGNKVTITDNFSLLGIQSVVQKESHRKMKSMRMGLLATNEKLKDNGLFRIKSKTKVTTTCPTLRMPSASDHDRKSLAPAITVKLSKYNTIPVFTPGDPSNHTHYLIPLDDMGYPLEEKITSESDLDTMTETLDGLDKGGMEVGLLTKASRAMKDRDALKKEGGITRVAKRFQNGIRESVMKAIKSNNGNMPVEISDNPSLFKMILANVLAKKGVRLLILPASAVTYFALDYDKCGVGKSRAAGINTLNSLRALMMYSSVNREVRSNIETVNVEIAIDPKSTDPDKVTAMTRRSVMKMYEHMLPGGLYEPTDMLKWIQRAGIRFSYTEHPGLPDTKLAFTKDITNGNAIDTKSTIMEDIRELTIMHMGTTLEMVDSGFDTAYASVAESNKQLMAKDAATDQATYEDLLSNYASQLLSSDGIFMNEIVSVVESDKSLSRYLSSEQKKAMKEDKNRFISEMVYNVVETVRTDYASVDTGDETGKSRAFNAMLDDLDKGMDFFLDSEFYDIDIVGDIGDFADISKAAWKAHFVRSWCSKNDFLPELNSMLATDSSGKPLNDIAKITASYTESMMKSMTTFIENLKSQRKKSNKAVEELDLDEEEEATPPEVDEEEEDDQPEV